MQTLQQAEGVRYILTRGVFRLCPFRFIVGLNGGVILGQHQFETNKTIHVAICQMMYHLLYVPSIWPVSQLQLIVGEITHCLFNLPGSSSMVAIRLLVSPPAK